ncbi:MAG: tripartite tricarboxylate transporter substrate-binding protein [Burkholderiales bacterium]
MHLQYKSIVAVTVAAVALTAMSPNIAHAQQKYPSKPIRLVVAFTAGGTPDTLARLIGPRLGETFGQPVIIENRPGAGGALAANIVAKAAPDGYTLLATSPGFAVVAALQPNLPYDPIKDFAGVANIGFSTNALVVAPSLGMKSVKDLIALGHAQPGKIFFGSAGAGSATHINAERFRLAAGIKAVHVGFKGQPEFLIEVVAGRVQFGMAGLGPAIGLIKDGRLQLLAVVPNRTPLFPDVPALSEILPSTGRDGYQAWIAPAGTPLAIRHQLSKEIARILALPEVRERLQSVAFHIAHGTPEETDKALRVDIASFNKLVRDAGLRAK